MRCRIQAVFATVIAVVAIATTAISAPWTNALHGTPSAFS
jgi:hypothetical protein